MNVHSAKTTAPIKKTKYHHGNLRNSIIDSVAQLIREKKGINFQLKEVANLVGTSQPAIYKHFANKNALLVETAVEGYSLQKQLRKQAFEKTDGHPLSNVFAIGQAYVHFSCIHPGFFLLMKNLETKEILSSKRYLAEREESRALVTSLVEACLEEGLFTEVNPQIAITVLQSIAYGLAHLYITGQIDIIAPDHVNEINFSEQVFAKGLEAFLSAKGRKKMAQIQVTTSTKALSS